MNKITKLSMFLCMLVLSSINLTANPLYMFFCCNTINAIVHPTLQTKKINNKDLEKIINKYHDIKNKDRKKIINKDFNLNDINDKNTRESIIRYQKLSNKQTAAHIQALRLNTIINNEQLMKDKNYSKIEELTFEKTIELYPNQHRAQFICSNEKLLPKYYDLYDKDDDDKNLNA